MTAQPLAWNLLERAYVVHTTPLVNINVDPFYDSRRSELRFQALVRKMGLGF